MTHTTRARFALVTLLAAASPAAAAEIVYDFPLHAFSGVNTWAFGFGHVTLDTDTNALAWDIQYINTIGSTFAAHFHGPAGPDEMAPVRVNITPSQVPDGPNDGHFIGNTVIDDTMETELTSGLWYVVVHTTAFPDGELRGQVVHDPPCPADLDLSGDVGFADLLVVIGAWGECGVPAVGSGACCFVSGTCVDDLPSGTCLGLAGYYEGDGTQCADNAVNCARDCAPDLDGSGDVGFGDILDLIGSWGDCPI